MAKIRNVGAGILLAGVILLSIGLVGQLTGLTTIVSGSGCGSWTLGNPSSQSQSSGTQWAANQLELLSEKYTPNFGTACSFDSTYATFEIVIQCVSGCGSGPTYATLNCATCYPGLNAAQATQDSSGNVNFLWGTSPTTGVTAAGTSSYPAGAVISIVLRAFIVQFGTHTADALTVYGTFIAGITGSAFDFTIGPAQNSLSFGAGSTGTLAIGVVPLNGYPGPTSLSVACSSTAISCSIAPSSIANNQLATLSVSGGIAGTYSVQITGTYTSSSGNIIRTLANSGFASGLPITVTSSGAGSTTPDFTITATTNLLTFPVGSTASTTLTFSSFNGFSGTVAVSAAATNTLGGANGGCSLSGSSVSISGSSPTATLTLSLTATFAGTFTCTVTGSSGSLSHILSVISNNFPGVPCFLSCTYLFIQPFAFNLAELFIVLGAVLIVVPFLGMRRRRVRVA